MRNVAYVNDSDLGRLPGHFLEGRSFDPLKLSGYVSTTSYPEINLQYTFLTSLTLSLKVRLFLFYFLFSFLSKFHM